ncbi:SDR family oxidoreductase (plasmid) [Rhizobium sp. WL3]|uniref:dTDP-4-dehydrorhamnose reductase family protein n=1 Tax=Rhizobium sp. WL3 TaxID=2603277 RepID=UPI0011C1F3E9|nr:SDR family oxidoreductase [Rhizobium sp. WL3]QEE43685.1 SDR family oxidoreductase [Rhizobium sp. WL3]
MRILVLGASGMLGNAMLRQLARQGTHQVFGSLRSASGRQFFASDLSEYLVTGIDVENQDSLMSALSLIKPDVVVNCIGLIKQRAEAEDPLQALGINSLLPHRLARLCQLMNARLVHISTDCVFSGRRGNYLETDYADAQDLYGRSKLLGEVDYPHAITLRTSIIGHELNGAFGLVGWFLSQQGTVKGYTRAIFSGLPTCELARVVRDWVLPRPELHGVYHVSARPIAKFELLQLVNQEYDKGLIIEPDEQLKIDRSLNSSRFRKATGYVAPEWPWLIAQMRNFH